MIYCPHCHAHYDERECPKHCEKCGKLIERLTMLSPAQLGQLNHGKSRSADTWMYIAMGTFLPLIGVTLCGRISPFMLLPVVTGGIMSAVALRIPYGQFRVFFLYLLPVAASFCPQTHFFGWLMIITGAMALSIWLKMMRM